MDRLLREGNPPVGQLASPKPQYKKPGVDEYAPVEGQHGAPFATLKDASGNIVSPATEAKLEQVRGLLATIDGKDFATQTTLNSLLTAFNAEDFASDDKLEAVRLLLQTLSSKDFATQTTLNALLTAFNGEDFATQTTLAQVLAKLTKLETDLLDVKANQLSGDQKVQLSGTLTELFGESLSDRPPANSVSVGATFMVVGDTVVYQSNGTDWVVISE